MQETENVTATASREKLMHALYEAAELEQNLMCTYLYAAFSLKDGDGELPAGEAEAVSRWRRAIIDVAIDEMNHLVAVWNITAALGGAPQFGRTNFPLSPGYLPAGISVRLAPFGEDVIQHFIHLERPQSSEEPDGAGFASEGPSRTPVPPRLTPAGYDYATIGIFYEKLEDQLRQLVATLGEEQVFCGDPALQLTTAQVGLAGDAVTGLDSALAALKRIIEEGEGAPESTENSHFQRFSAIREELRDLTAHNPDFAPAYPCAVNPVLRKPPRPEGRIWLEHPEAVAAVDLANAIYALALRLLAATYVISPQDSNKALYAGCAIGLMHGIGHMAQRAARLPAGPSHPGINAGITFTALRNASSLPPGPSAHRFFVERIEELARTAETLDQADPHCHGASVLLGKIGQRLKAAVATDAGGPVVATAAPVAAQSVPTLSSPGDGASPVEGRDIAISFDGPRCIHARMCVTRAPSTFLADREGPWIFPDATDAELLSAVIRECPSGALQYARKDGRNEPLPPVNLVTLRENGPYAVRAQIVIDGKPDGYRAALCRCGASRRKPWCDKSHVNTGFIATGEPETRQSEALAVRDGPLAVAPEIDGPLHVTGNLEIVSGTGRIVSRVVDTRLCRCGGSGNKPFCDGTHRKIGFRSE